MFLSNIENDEARGISPMCTYTPSHFSFRGIESSYKFEKASSMGRAPWRNPRKLWVRVPCLPPPTFRLHFAAQNVPILILGTEEVVGSNPTSNPTADGLYLRIAQSGRAPKKHIPPLLNFNVANGVPIHWLVFRPQKGREMGFKSPYTPRH